MELREVDPKTLLDNPENPRKSAPNEAEERQLALNVKAVGSSTRLWSAKPRAA
ncbi:hypothetical protein [Komagataeibacter kakiaceti]|uniref:hypothetical protein n=1 Tax=Komagataeibacter kakiaceti TaxID=943261 RepID=UPI000A62D6E8|nr:hypothetical protein [Komagataeibacter kakiaceti]